MSSRKFKNAVKKFITGNEPGINSFSQGGEDMILRAIFRKKFDRREKGFYVDIGAYHPSYMSNTYLFYISGWRGINIDACPGSMKAFNKLRPKDVNLEIGVGRNRETLTYYYINEHSTMNSFSKAFLEEIGMAGEVTKELPVDVYPLKEVLKQHASEFTHIDILNIDAEGLDQDIIESNDWALFRPSVIIIEMSCETIEKANASDTAKFLRAVGYKIIAKNVILKNVASVFFADEHFDY